MRWRQVSLWALGLSEELHPLDEVQRFAHEHLGSAPGWGLRAFYTEEVGGVRVVGAGKLRRGVESGAELASWF